MIQEINHQNFELKIIIDELKQCQQNNSLKYYDANFKKAIKDLANSEDLDTLSTNNQLIEKQIEQIKLNENKTTILSIQQKIKGLYFCSNPKQDHENQNDQKSIRIEDNFRNIIHNFSNILEMLLNLNCINILIMNETMSLKKLNCYNNSMKKNQKMPKFNSNRKKHYILNLCYNKKNNQDNSQYNLKSLLKRLKQRYKTNCRSNKHFSRLNRNCNKQNNCYQYKYQLQQLQLACSQNS
ncbi:hypothetical protein ABPG72_000508 [Tetrahymena utriculariae]